MPAVTLSGFTYFPPSSTDSSDLSVLDLVVPNSVTKRVESVTILIPSGHISKIANLQPGQHRFTCDIRPRSAGKSGSNYWFTAYHPPEK